MAHPEIPLIVCQAEVLRDLNGIAHPFEYAEVPPAGVDIGSLACGIDRHHFLHHVLIFLLGGNLCIYLQEVAPDERGRDDARGGLVGYLLSPARVRLLRRKASTAGRLSISVYMTWKA